MVKTHLLPGFRFHPTDVELVKYYLKRKVMGIKLHFEAIAEVDIYKFAPSDLPDQSRLRTGDLKWYFFCPRERKYASGARINRAAECGYWKTTGKDRPVLDNKVVVGMIKTLIFHHGKAPRGERTDWVMHEYRLEDKELAQRNVVQDAYVLCVVFKKDGPGPRNGAQYGAPFREEDWSDDEDVDVPEALPLVDRPPRQHAFYAATGSPFLSNPCPGLISQSSVSDAAPANTMPPPVVDSNGTPMSEEAPQVPNDDISSMFDLFLEDENFLFSDHNQNELHHDVNLAGFIDDSLRLEGDDIFSGLADLDNLAGPSRSLFTMPTESNAFLELQDLDVPLNFPYQAQDFSNLENNGVFPGQSVSNVPSQTHFPADPSSSVAAEHASVLYQMHLQPNETYSDCLNTLHKRSF